jgi:outer membrane protein insertion porin family
VSAHRCFPWAAAFFLLTPGLSALEVRELKIEGNSLSGDRVFFRNLRTRAGEEYSPLILNEDIKRLYELGRFEKIEVKETVIDEKSVDLLIVVKEKVKLRELRYEGFKDLATSSFEEKMRSTKGGRFDDATVKADLASIRRAYRENGHLFADVEYRVDPVSGENDTVDLVFIATEHREVRIGDIVFDGNDHMPKSQLRKAMETGIDRLFGKGVYDAEVFSLDLKKMESYYRSIGYLDAKVTEGKSYFSENKEWLYLHVKVEEGSLYVIDSIEISGNKVIPTDELYSKLVTREGAPYTDYVRLDIADRIEKAYGEIGRVFTVARLSVEMSERQPHVHLKVAIEEGEEVYLEKILVEGNNKTRDVVIRRELEFYPGERINTLLVDRSKRNLGNLGFFSKNDVDIVPGETRDKASVIVRVTEKETGSINFALGFSSVESIFGQVKYTQRNFDWRDRERGLGSFFTGDGYIGDGQNLSVSINTGSESRRYNVDFSEPWVFNRKIRFGFGAYHTESSLAYDYDETSDGLYTRIGKEFARDLEGSLTYTIRQNEISNVASSVSQAIKDEVGVSTVSSIRNDWEYEGRDNRFFPTKGWYWHPALTVAGSWLGGSEDFYKIELESKNHQLVFDFGDEKEHVLSHRLKLAMVENYGSSKRVAIFERFFAGGMGTVRGFANRSLGPRSNGDEVGGKFLAVYNLEYSVPINERMIRGVFFSDTGNVYKSIGSFSTSELRSSLGFGLRIQIPALGPMPLALDFAKPIRQQDGDEKETFSFNFGNFF